MPSQQPQTGEIKTEPSQPPPRRPASPVLKMPPGLEGLFENYDPSRFGFTTESQPQEESDIESPTLKAYGSFNPLTVDERIFKKVIKKLKKEPSHIKGIKEYPAKLSTASRKDFNIDMKRINKEYPNATKVVYDSVINDDIVNKAKQKVNKRGGEGGDDEDG